MIIFDCLNSKKKLIATGCVLLVTIFCIVYSVVQHIGYTKCTFLFMSSDGHTVCKEKRYISIKPSLEETITVYIEELLLGSVHRDRKMLFPYKTQVLSCFLRSSDLYVNLSESGASEMMTDDDFRKKCTLFERNIFTNYKKVARIYVYIGGKSVYAVKKTETEIALPDF